jgi:hypothetical protein
MCQFQRLLFDAALVLREFPPAYSLETLLHAARRLGFDVGARDAQPGGNPAPTRLASPCSRLCRRSQNPPLRMRHQDPRARPHRVAVIVRASGDEFQTIEPGRAAPER